MRVRNSEKSKKDILIAAENEFANSGFYGARVDAIAKKANINKRMIYEYYENKEGLYRKVLSSVYERLTTKELEVFNKGLDEIGQIQEFINLYFRFLYNDPNYVSLILYENLNKGKYIDSTNLDKLKLPTFDHLRVIIKEGKTKGIFQSEADIDEVILSVLTFTFSTFSNRYTLSKLLNRELVSDENIKKRAKFIGEILIGYLVKKQ